MRVHHELHRPPPSDLVLAADPEVLSGDVMTVVVKAVEFGPKLPLSELMRHLIAHSLSSILRLPMAKLAAEPTLKNVIEKIVKECNAIGEAVGVGWLGSAADVLDFLAAGRAHFPRTAVDAFCGREAKGRWMNHLVIALGAAHRIETPVNRLLLQLVEGDFTVSARALCDLADFVSKPGFALAA